MMDSEMASIFKQEYDFFTNEEKLTPMVFFKKFNCKLKQMAISSWYSVPRKILKICKNDLKLVNIKQNYKDGKYKQTIKNYFKQAFLRKKRFVKYICDVLYLKFVCPKFFYKLPNIYW